MVPIIILSMIMTFYFLCPVSPIQDLSLLHFTFTSTRFATLNDKRTIAAFLLLFNSIVNIFLSRKKFFSFTRLPPAEVAQWFHRVSHQRRWWWWWWWTTFYYLFFVDRFANGKWFRWANIWGIRSPFTSILTGKGVGDGISQYYHRHGKRRRIGWINSTSLSLSLMGWWVVVLLTFGRRLANKGREIPWIRASS